MLDDILMETPAFQALRKAAEEKGLATGLEKGLEKGLATGLEKGREEGLEEGLRNAIVSFVDIQFAVPGLTQMAKERVEALESPDLLRSLLTNVYRAR